MFARALLFLFALVFAAAAIGPLTESKRHYDAAWSYRFCARRIEQELLLQLPLTPEELPLATADPFWPRDIVPDPYRPLVSRAVLRECGERPVDHPEQRVALAVAVLAGGGFLLYWLLPYLTILRYGLTRERPREPGTVNPDGTPTLCLVTPVRHLAADTGVTVHAVLFNAGDDTANAVAFGHVGRRYVELSSGMEDLLVKDPPAFDAVVLHELGHIRNRDLDVTQGVTALWWVFVTLVTATFGLSLTTYSAQDKHLRSLCMQLLLLTFLVYAARNSYLHSRELHADAFAAGRPARGTAGGTVRQALDRFLVRVAGERPAKRVDTSAWPFATHPSPARRRASLARPVLADEFTGWEAALIGCILTFAANLVTGHSLDMKMFGLRIGVLDLEGIDLNGVYVRSALPLLLVAGPVIALGLRHSVRDPGRFPWRRSVPFARQAVLASCLWAGTCLGCLLRPGPLTETPSPHEMPVMLWQTLTGSPALGLAVTCTATVGLCTLVALGTEAVAPPRRPALLLHGAYGALVTVAWFPAALPAGLRPYCYAVVLALPLLAAVPLVRPRRRPPAGGVHHPPVEAEFGRGTVTGASAPLRTRVLVACHLATFGVSAWALVLTGRLLAFSAPPAPLTLVKTLGLLLFVLAVAGAALAPDDAVFRRRVHAAICCFGGVAVLACLEGIANGTLSPMVFLTLLAPACAVPRACEVTAAALYDLRHRRSGVQRPPGSPPAGAAEPAGASPAREE
ncbi:M48 family metalloprotease [Streptomyces manipurensis]|uniref:M48 family metalloprotease n=1 Tax=Streptomyces manipurensis TaxID=1077945 RepID=UPI003C6FDAE8